MVPVVWRDMVVVSSVHKVREVVVELAWCQSVHG